VENNIVKKQIVEQNIEILEKKAEIVKNNLVEKYKYCEKIYTEIVEIKLR